MAIRHDLAGQWGKGEAKRINRTYFQRLIVFSSLAMLLAGFILGLMVGHYSNLAAVAVPLAVLFGVFVVSYLIWKKIDPIFDTLAKERIKHLRGAQAEALVAWLLQDLDDEWQVFNTVQMEKGSDLDHVLAGPGGVYCIQTKSHRGHFVGTVDGITHNGDPCEFAKDALMQALRLRDRLAALMGDGVPFVQPVLAVPFGYTEGKPCGGKVWLVHAEDLTDTLAPDDRKPRLGKADLTRIVKAAESIHQNAEDLDQRQALAR